MCLALACDIRVAKSSANLGFTFVNLGIHPVYGLFHTVFLSHTALDLSLFQFSPSLKQSYFLSVSISPLCPSVCLCLCLSLCVSLSPVSLSVNLSVCLSACQSIYLLVCTSCLLLSLLRRGVPSFRT